MVAERADHGELTGNPHGRIPSIFSFIRYSPPRAQMYRVFPSASPQAKLCGCFGGIIVPRCLPSGEIIQRPPGPEKIGRASCRERVEVSEGAGCMPDRE